MPAPTVQPSRVSRPSNPKAVTNHAIFVTSPGGAAPDVIQPAVNRISEAAGDASQKICPCGDPSRIADVDEIHCRSAFHGGARDGTFDTSHPVGGELVIATKLPSDHRPGRSDLGSGDESGRRSKSILFNERDWVRDILPSPAATGVGPQETTGPSERRQHGRLGGQIRGTCRDAQRSQCSTDEHQLFHEKILRVHARPYMANQAWRNRVFWSWAPTVVPSNLL